MVRRRQDQPQLQLPRPPRARGPRRTRPRSSGKASRATSGRITYDELHRDVSADSPVRLQKLGVNAGDRVAHLHADDPRACRSRCSRARASARRTPWSSAASRPRRCATAFNDAQAKVVITADGGWRRGKPLALKDIVDEAVAAVPDRSRRSSCCERLGTDGSGPWNPGRDIWWHDAVAGVRARRRSRAGRCRASAVHPLHVGHHRESRRASCTRPAATWCRPTSRRSGSSTCTTTTSYWCTADVGWVTGHSYFVYGPLLNGATAVMYEGAPNTPDFDRFWKIVEDYKVTILYTAPTAIRTFMRWGDEHPASVTICRACACSAPSASRSIRKRGCGTARDRRRALPDRRYVVADRDRRHHDHAASRRDRDQAGLRARCRSRAWTSRSSTATGNAVPAQRRAACSSSASRGPACCAPIYGDPERYKQTVLVDASPACTSPATARGATRTATSG